MLRRHDESTSLEKIEITANQRDLLLEESDEMHKLSNDIACSEEKLRARISYFSGMVKGVIGAWK